MNKKTKLTNTQVREIRAKYMAYIIGYRRLAKEYNCGESTIRDIVTYRTRKNVL